MTEQRAKVVLFAKCAKLGSIEAEIVLQVKRDLFRETASCRQVEVTI